MSDGKTGRQIEDDDDLENEEEGEDDEDLDFDEDDSEDNDDFEWEDDEDDSDEDWEDDEDGEDSDESDDEEDGSSDDSVEETESDDDSGAEEPGNEEAPEDANASNTEPAPADSTDTDINFKKEEETDQQDAPTADGAVHEEETAGPTENSQEQHEQTADGGDAVMAPATNDNSTSKPATLDKKTLNSLPVQLTFETARQQVSLSELRGIKAGHIFTSQDPVTSPLEIRANGKLIGHGKLVSVEGNIGVQITELL